MMDEMTLHTGCAGDTQKINIDWFDHNNVPQKTELVICIRQVDKPRTLEIKLNGVIVGVVPPRSAGMMRP
jgi:hypothetical protein